MDLRSLGADAALLGAFQTYNSRGLALARVATSNHDRYRLFAEAGEFDAEPSGLLWHTAGDRAAMPVAGDWVAARVVGAGQAIVEAVLPRRTLFARRAAGRREERQAIAANIDLVFLVSGLDGDFNVRRIERYLALAAESGAAPVIVLNKADACPDLAGCIEDAATVAGSAPIVACSARQSEGMEELLAFAAPGRTVALLGSSGVGKSTIANRLLGEERFRTAETREADGRGRHTTTHRELVPLPGGGVLIDTPGMRELQLWAGEDAIESTFDEIAELAAGCRFRDCSHSGETGCAVSAAVEAGTVDRGRFAGYRKLMAEARHHEAQSDRFAAAEEKRRWKVIHKAAKRYQRETNR